MNLLTYPDREMLVIDLANKIAGELNSALKTDDEVSLAVCGGTTPGPVFDDLCAADLDWSRVTVLPTDERCVPEGDERSNSRLISQRLLTDRASAAKYLSFYREGQDPAAAAEEVSASVSALTPLSIVLLGMGEDMHTASLFPGGDALDMALGGHAPDVVAMRAPAAPEARLTLSAKALNGAMSKHLVIFGDKKREALERAQHLRPAEAPVRAVLHDLTVHWAE